MTPQDIEAVQRSYAKLDEHRELFAQVFYERLFATNPNIALMFDRNLMEQAERFRVMLFTVVYGINRAEELKPALRSLGQRHIGYGVRAADYAAFEDALIWALQHFLNDAFDANLRRAWKAFYGFVCETMLEGARHRLAPEWTMPLAGGTRR